MKTNTRKIAGVGLLTAVVVVLQLLGSFIHFGPFSISLVLIPIVVGASLYGVLSGAWLGLAFGITVLISGNAAAFLAVNPGGTVITVLLKGALAGLLAGAVYKAIEKKNKVIATIVAAIICPVVNTGIFLIGCRLFFFDTIKTWAAGTNVFVYMITGLVGFNFLFELGLNIILSPTIVKLTKLGRKENNNDFSCRYRQYKYSLGILDGDTLINECRLSTAVNDSAEEYAIKLNSILEICKINPEDIEGSVISSVVPPLIRTVSKAIMLITGKKSIVIGPGVKTGLNIKTNNPAELGADMVAGAVASIENILARKLFSIWVLQLQLRLLIKTAVLSAVRFYAELRLRSMH